MQIFLYNEYGELQSMNTFCDDIDYYIDNTKIKVFKNLQQSYYSMFNKMKLQQILNLSDIEKETKVLIVKQG